ncbi:dipeptidase AC [Oceaniovalibus guishaninsula JLT2003]|uniref:Dipeptidase AC n=1 Tax=Oceaniovalibus guishaninsula JLT2003 TaxID=1231392 RepID=K2I6Q8_9RHOB|nr:dipeptidase [Oceaniovalibus guishaninsula]EKE44645.1 dipeptidase AC [Oceaniovalibus guishaninsula JLT2003]
MIPIFDGHNDVLSRLAQSDAADPVAGFIDGDDGAIDASKARRGGLAGGFFAMWVPTEGAPDYSAAMRHPPYDVPLPAPVAEVEAIRTVTRQAAILLDLERRGALRICRDIAALRDCIDTGTLAAILHLEGAEAIGADLHMLDLLYAAGLRSLGPVWSRSTIFGEGVPFRYPSDGEIGAGLTAAGRTLVRRCDRLGVMVDLSHLNAAGIRDVAEISSRPLVATHSNAHAVSPHSRNLTDAQLDLIARSDGLVGLNFAVSFLRPDGRKDTDVPMAVLLDHLDHLIARLGEDRVGLGSDFDGALVPRELAGADRLDVLRDAMAVRGYDGDRIAKICHRNWLRVLDLSWRPAR